MKELSQLRERVTKILNLIKVTFVFSHHTIDWSLSSGRWAFAVPESPILPKSRPKRPVEFAEADLSSLDFFLSTGFDAFLSSSCLGWELVGAKAETKNDSNICRHPKTSDNQKSDKETRSTKFTIQKIR